MIRKITILAIVFVLSGLFLPTIQADSGVELVIKIHTGFRFPVPTYTVENIGDAPAHNVKITDTSIEGNILYNNRVVNIADIIEPDQHKFCDSDSWFVGFGLFSIVVTVTCDEGVFTSSETNGFIIGPFIFIP